MKAIKVTLGCLLFLLLQACAQLDLQAPQSFNQKIAIAYGSVAEVRKAAVILLEQGKISANDAQNVQAAADASRAALDVARQLASQDLSAAQAKLAAAHTGILALQTYLASRGK